MSAEDGGGPVDLLAEHDAGQHVRPGGPPERHHVVGAAAQVRVQPVRPADDAQGARELRVAFANLDRAGIDTMFGRLEGLPPA